MKQGNSFSEIKAELARLETMKKDYDVSSFRLELTPESKLKVALRGGEKIMDPTATFHGQAAQKLGIPRQYYNRMLTHKPSLLAENVNSWLRNEDKHFTLRTYQGENTSIARALLSDRYRAIDHIEVTDTMLDALDGVRGLEMVSSGLTEERVYYKYLFPAIEGEIRPGDVCKAGFVISNSEVGLGACYITPLIYRLVCTNGMIVATREETFRKFHIGKVREIENDISVYAEKDANILLMNKITTFINEKLNDSTFDKYFEKMRSATQAKTGVDAKTLIERSAKKFNLNENEAKIVLEHFHEDGDLTLYGLSNAITRASQDIEGYTRATELEGLGWDILSINKKTWEELNEVA